MAAMMSQQAQSSGQKASSESSESHVGYPIEELLNCENKPAKTDTAFFTYGRFQPGHIGHKIMIDQLLRQALQHNTTTGTKITPEKTNVYVFVSPSGGPKEKDKKKNPLSPNQKVDLLQKQYAGYPIHFINMGAPLPKDYKTDPFGALELLKKCYSNKMILVGEDRVKMAQLMIEYGLTRYEFAERSKDAMSATQLRQAAVDNNDDVFNHGIQFGAVTPEHSALIKRIIRAEYGLQGGKRRKRTRRRWRKPRRRKTRRKTRRKNKRKRKRRKTKKRMCRFR